MKREYKDQLDWATYYEPDQIEKLTPEEIHKLDRKRLSDKKTRPVTKMIDIPAKTNVAEIDFLEKFQVTFFRAPDGRIRLTLKSEIDNEHYKYRKVV